MLKNIRDDHHDTVYISYTTNEIYNRHTSTAYSLLLYTTLYKENDDLLHNKKRLPPKITVKYPIFRFLIHPATFHDIKLKLVNVNFWEIALYVYLPRVTKMCQEGIHKISCG